MGLTQDKPAMRRESAIEEETAKLQHNLIISHAVGVGKPISKNLSRVMMISKIHALSKGFSGCLWK